MGLIVTLVLDLEAEIIDGSVAGWRLKLLSSGDWQCENQKCEEQGKDGGLPQLHVPSV
jgi:hypothetical protein